MDLDGLPHADSALHNGKLAPASPTEPDQAVQPLGTTHINIFTIIKEWISIVLSINSSVNSCQQLEIFNSYDFFKLGLITCFKFKFI